MNPLGWKAVDSFGAGGPLHTVQTAIANADLANDRFLSDAGSHALLLPVEPLAEGEVPGIAITDAPAEAAEVLFLDPPDGTSALSLLAALGDRARWVRVALPSKADSTGLIPEAGRVTVVVGSGSPVAYQLFRVADPTTLDPHRPAGAPRLGESDDVLEQRSKWFQAREGRGD